MSCTKPENIAGMQSEESKWRAASVARTETSFAPPGTVAYQSIASSAFGTPVALTKGEIRKISLGELVELEKESLSKKPGPRKSLVKIAIIAVVVFIVLLVLIASISGAKKNQPANQLPFSFGKTNNIKKLCEGPFNRETSVNKVLFSTCSDGEAHVCENIFDGEGDLESFNCENIDKVCKCPNSVLLNPTNGIIFPEELCSDIDDEIPAFCFDNLDTLKLSEVEIKLNTKNIFTKAVEECEKNSKVQSCIQSSLKIECDDDDPGFKLENCGVDCTCTPNEFLSLSRNICNLDEEEECVSEDYYFY